jgi:alpha/beta superfamily hydrolase
LPDRTVSESWWNSIVEVDEVRFTTDDGVSLEGELRPPRIQARGSAVVCHADPRQGGSKDHPVLWAIRNELSARGFAVLSFNFRGVMQSGGSFSAGRGEVGDAAAAIARVREAADGPTLVCGWSFGANVALREAVQDERVSALALVGLPLGESAVDLPDLPAPSDLRIFGVPVLLASGQGDTISPRPELETLARRLPRAEVAIVLGTDHFFWHREKELAGRIADFADEVLATAARGGERRSPT